MAMVAMKVLILLSKRVATLRQSRAMERVSIMISALIAPAIDS